MKKLYPALWLFFSGFGLQAQSDWQLFRPGVQYLYDYAGAGFPESPVLGIKVGADTCTEMYTSLRWYGEFECNEVAPSFMGYEVCQTGELTRLHLREDKYVYIRQTAAPGEEWLAYAEEGDTVWGKVFSIQNMSFLGLTDSVKSLHFYRQENNGPIEYLPGNNRPMTISKHYGLISTFGFREFPYFWPQNMTELMPLIGMSEPKVGMQNTTKDDVFSLQVNDELHILRTTASVAYDQMGEYLGDGFWREFFKITITEIETTSLPDFIKYHYTGQRLVTRRIGLPTASYNVYPVEDIADNWEFDLAFFEFLNLQPGALFPIPSQFDGEMASVFLQNYSSCDERPGKRLGPEIGGNEFCLHYFPDANGSSIYTEGLAGGYYDFSSVGGHYTRTLVYFRRDTSECGIPFDFNQITSADEAAETLNILLGPNPTPGPLQLQLPQGLVADLKLYDLQGRLLWSENQAQGTVAWNLGTLPAGAYQISASVNGGLVWRQRVLKL